MARKDEEKVNVYQIPKNFEEKSVTSSGLSYRNIVEAVIIVGIIVAILWFCPIDSNKIKIMIGILVAGPLGALALFGINKCSISEFLLNFIKYKLTPSVYVRKSIFKK